MIIKLLDGFRGERGWYCQSGHSHSGLIGKYLLVPPSDVIWGCTSGRLGLYSPGLGFQGLVLSLSQWVDHGHVHIEVVSLLKPPAALVTGKVQLRLCLVLGHVVLEGCPLPALEPAHLTPGGRAG